MDKGVLKVQTIEIKHTIYEDGSGNLSISCSDNITVSEFVGLLEITKVNKIKGSLENSTNTEL